MEIKKHNTDTAAADIPMTDAEKRKKIFKKILPYLLEVLLFAFIITFDLCMKGYLYRFLSEKPYMSMTFIKGFMDLSYVENTGAGFGMFQNGTLPLSIITGIVILAVIVYLCVYRKDSRWIRVPLIMVAAGGIGNLVDRIALGYVRDFFEFTFMDFAVFNIADAFVVVGAIVLIIYLLIAVVFEVKRKKKTDDASDGGENNGSVNITDNSVHINVSGSTNIKIGNGLGDMQKSNDRIAGVETDADHAATDKSETSAQVENSARE